jgi:simple sugar transport system permease protein/ribose transport system permease protein
MTLSVAKPLIRRHAEIGIFLIGAILVVMFASTSDGKWANLYNIGTILQVTATLGLMSLGVALVIGTGEIDISVGSTFGMGALAYLWLAALSAPQSA